MSSSANASGPRDIRGHWPFAPAARLRLLGAAVGLAVVTGCSASASPVVTEPTATPTASISGTTSAGDATTEPTDSLSDPSGPTVVAFLTDFGNCDSGQQEVADMVNGWDADAIVTGGDNTQGEEDCVPYEDSVNDYYADWLDEAEPRFFPALGNHDYENETAGLAAYTRAFPYLPRDADPHGRWYEKTIGDITFFFLDSDAPPGDQTAQRAWVEDALRAAQEQSPDRWRVVVAHRPPFSSGVHGSWEAMQPDAGWEFDAWGADIVLSGHQHVYEDVVVDEFHYVTGTTGASGTVRECGEVPVEGSQVCIEGAGALLLETADDELSVELHRPEDEGEVAHRVILRR